MHSVFQHHHETSSHGEHSFQQSAHDGGMPDVPTKKLRRGEQQLATDLFVKLTKKFEAPEKPHLQLPSCPRNLSELADSPILTTIVFMCVILNGIQMGVTADYEVDDGGFLDNFFTAVFASEMLIKVIAWRKQYFRSLWNAFDFFLTWMSILDVWVLSVMGGGQGMKSLSVLRIMRVFRVVRLLRMVKCLREVTLILNGLVSACKTIFWVSILLLLVLYIFAIFCSSTVGQPGIYAGYNEIEIFEAESFNSYQYFGTIPRSMFSLLNIALLSDDWFVISRAVMEKQPLVLFILLFFVLLTSIGLIHVIAGTLVEHVITSANLMRKDDESAQKADVLECMRRFYECMFEKSHRHEGIGEEALEQVWNTDAMQDFVSLLNLPVGVDSKFLMELLDTNGDEHLSITEFVENTLRLVMNDMFQHILEVKSGINRLLREEKVIEEGVAQCKKIKPSKENAGIAENNPSQLAQNPEGMQIPVVRGPRRMSRSVLQSQNEKATKNQILEKLCEMQEFQQQQSQQVQQQLQQQSQQIQHLQLVVEKHLQSQPEVLKMQMQQPPLVVQARELEAKEAEQPTELDVKDVELQLDAQPGLLQRSYRLQQPPQQSGLHQLSFAPVMGHLQEAKRLLKFAETARDKVAAGSHINPQAGSTADAGAGCGSAAPHQRLSVTSGHIKSASSSAKVIF